MKSFCIAEGGVACRNSLGRFVSLLVTGLALGGAEAQPASAPALPSVAASAWIATPRVSDRLRAADIGLVINTADPASVQVGEYYIAVRKLAPEQVLRVEVPVRPALTRDEFQRLVQAIDAHFGRSTQALALAWTAPYAVACNSITGALALGYDADLCKQSCGASRVSRYFNSPSARPFNDLGWRPSMLLAARSVAEAKALIDRGAAADGALALRGRPPVTAMLLSTDDVPRRVRMRIYPPPGLLRAVGVAVRVAPAAELAAAHQVLLVTTGSVKAPVEPAPDWAPGGLGDHLTSFGGDLLGAHGQGTALDWIAAGAVASYGTVSEPCNHLQKFPHPQVLLGQYVQGATAIEAYWKSVAWPQQGLFVGDPLAAPFARR
jgi:uncharacterized protein (TIGR03790 family)